MINLCAAKNIATCHNLNLNSSAGVKLKLSCTVYTTYQYYAPLPLSQVMSGKWWEFELYKIQMHHLLAMGMPVSQIPTLTQPKTWGLLVNVHTSVHVYMVSGQIPYI